MNTMTKNELKSYLTNYKIYSWMYSDYNLKGLEKELYAIIYKCTEDIGCYSGSLSILTDVTGYSRQSIIPSLKKLVDLGIVYKDQYTYKATIKEIC